MHRKSQSPICEEKLSRHAIKKELKICESVDCNNHLKINGSMLMMSEKHRTVANPERLRVNDESSLGVQPKA